VNTAIARLAASQVLSRIQVGSLVICGPDGRRHRFGSGPPEATLNLRADRAWRSFLGGSLGLADAYADGLWDSPDLVAVVRLAARNMPVLDDWRRRIGPIVRPVQLLRAIRRPRGREQSRRDIAAHYDLGNDLFSRMLDPTMTYSCAIFDAPELTLEQAQRVKLECVCEKLELAAGQRVLEIGSGWGSFALYAAATRGCQVTTTTISREQYDYVIDRVQRAGLTDLITVLFEDYRDLAGRYDRLVSIEMIEAVGWQNIGRFLAKCASLLEPSGAMLLQAITIDDRAYAVERASRSFIKEYIFPGGSLPSAAVIAGKLARHTDLQPLDLEDITAHYVATLRCWRQSLLEHAGELAALGYDERFARVWELYLAYCEGGFAERRICDVQLLLAKPRFRPETRATSDTARLRRRAAA
jgi:cyclopropane-fatty-acyl-phospholipid synthase